MWPNYNVESVNKVTNEQIPSSTEIKYGDKYHNLARTYLPRFDKDTPGKDTPGLGLVVIPVPTLDKILELENYMLVPKDILSSAEDKTNILYNCVLTEVMSYFKKTFLPTFLNDGVPNNEDEDIYSQIMRNIEEKCRKEKDEYIQAFLSSVPETKRPNISVICVRYLLRDMKDNNRRGKIKISANWSNIFDTFSKDFVSWLDDKYRESKNISQQMPDKVTDRRVSVGPTRGSVVKEEMKGLLSIDSLVMASETVCGDIKYEGEGYNKMLELSFNNGVTVKGGIEGQSFNNEKQEIARKIGQMVIIEDYSAKKDKLPVLKTDSACSDLGHDMEYVLPNNKPLFTAVVE